MTTKTASSIARSLLAVFLVLGCSSLNRSGPDVTCVDLQNGAENACSEGIIATCSGDRVDWRVCGDKGACEADWQIGGRYRCAQTDVVPVLSPTTVAGTGGSAGVAGGPGVSGVGGNPALGAAVAVCGTCPTGYRQIANACNHECGDCGCFQNLCATNAQSTAGVGLGENSCSAGMHSILSVPDCDATCASCGTRELCVAN